MGPTFAGMLFSGRKAAQQIIKALAPAEDFSRKEAVTV